MSLIHDSLRKLENNQSSSTTGLDSNVEKFNPSNGLNARKLWMLLVAVVGIVLIVYAYMMLAKYQKQNEILMNDMKQLKTTSAESYVKVGSEMKKPLNKIIVQPPITIENKPVTNSYVSRVANVEQPKNINSNLGSQDNSLIEEQSITALNADFLLVKDSQITKIQEKPVPIKKKRYKKKTNKKLSIKQTRQLVNNLQIQIDSKNTDEVTKLLKTLSLSSGENSLVYLRMNAYWSSTIDDDSTAAIMYKKILYQNPQDIQANTNLALLEARNNKLDQAISRLKALRIEYPTNKSVQTYLERIESLNVK